MTTRRQFCKLSAGALLAAGLWPGRLRAAENGKGDSDWTFLAVNDLHYSDAQCAPWFEKVVAAMKASAPKADFCIISGDQANGGTKEQLTSVRDIFKTLGMPFYTTPGNHDHVKDYDRTAYDAIFPGQLNQTFEHRGWQMIGLDTSDGTKSYGTTIHDSTFEWLRTNLPKLDKTKPTILFTHFPLGTKLIVRPLNAEALLGTLAEFNLQAALSGHWHGFTEETRHSTTLTTDRCCSRVRDNHDGTKEKGWFVCTVKDGTVSRRFIEIPEELRAKSA